MKLAIEISDNIYTTYEYNYKGTNKYKNIGGYENNYVQNTSMYNKTYLL